MYEFYIYKFRTWLNLVNLHFDRVQSQDMIVPADLKPVILAAEMRFCS